MDASELVRARDEVVASHGPWWAHSIHLIDAEVIGESRAPDRFDHNGVIYRGMRWKESVGGDSHSRDVLWASMDNLYSFVLTRDPLMNALIGSGFTAALECHLPGLPEAVARVTVLATCGQPQQYVIVPGLHDAPMDMAQELHLLNGWRNPSPAVHVWSLLRESARRDQVAPVAIETVVLSAPPRRRPCARRASGSGSA
jgi:hypothetical protein